MDSRNDSIHNRQGITLTPPPYAYHHHSHNDNNSNSPFPTSNLIPTSSPYAFNSISAQFDSSLFNHTQQQQQQQNGSSSGAALDAEQSGRRRRGRPRKYSPDAAGLVSPSSSQVVSVAAGCSGKNETGGEVNGEGNQGRRQRGRPPGSGKKQLDALGGVAGSGFTPHVIKVFPQEDVVSKVNEFCQEGPRTIIILSAYGGVCNATIQRAGSTDESGTIFCEGYSDILHLAGPFFSVNCNEIRGNDFDLIVLLMGSDGKSSGGKVVGKLTAATTIQIIAASYISEPKKSNGNIPPPPPPPPPVSSSLLVPVSHMLAFGGHSTGNINAPINAACDCSDDNGANCSHSLGPDNNNTNYPMNNLPMYQQHHMSWSNTGLSDVHQNNNNNNNRYK